MDRRSRVLSFLRTPFEGIPRVALVLFAVGSAFAFLFFNQPDLFHTVISSFAYLDGHVFSFYDVNKVVVGGNDYLPGIYIIFAIWMSPFKLFGGMTPDALRPALILSPVELFWAKFLLLLVFLVCFYLISAIAKHAFSTNDDAQRTVRAAYLFSPLVGFAVFTFGQYDLFSTLFTLVGVLMYFRRRSFWFVFWFSIAISFKYFAIFLFIPLALYYFKRPLRILLSLVGGAAFTLLELAAYWHSIPFRATAFRLAEGKAGDPLTNQILILMAILFAVLCVLAFLYGRRSNELSQPLILIWVAGLAIMFLAVTWHPQWTVILAPAFALSLGLMKRPGWFLIWESVAFVAFVVVVTNRWVSNVDATMITRGILSSLIGDPTLLQSNIVGAKFEPYASMIVTVLFLSPLVWLACERAIGWRDSAAKNPRKWIWSVRALTVSVVLTVPSLIFTFIPWETAVALVPSAVANGTAQVTSTSAAPSAFDPVPGETIAQDFRVSGNGLTGVAVQTATYMRTNPGSVDVTLENSNGDRVAGSTITASSLSPDGRIYLAFGPIPDSDGQTFTLIITQASPAETVGFWVAPHQVGSAFDSLTVAGATEQSTLSFTYFLRG